MIVKIERYYSYPDLKRQTPNNSFKWKDITFTEDNIDECDYLVILEYPKNDFSIKVNKNNIIHICQEPPNEVSKYRQYSNKNVAIVINQLETRSKNILSHGALPWHIDKDFDFLNTLKFNDINKENEIVWVTSNQNSSKGHQSRMEFLNNIKNLPFINLYGRGINPIEDKWSVLSNSKYAIAYENFKSEYYWTEKIADCFLSYTMPIYYGNTSIENYFPKKSFIQLDSKDKHIHLFLKEIIKSNIWEENIEYIIEARNLILKKYQLFPFLYDKIMALESMNGEYFNLKKEIISFKGGNNFYNNYPLKVLIDKNIYKIKGKINR